MHQYNLSYIVIYGNICHRAFNFWHFDYIKLILETDLYFVLGVDADTDITRWIPRMLVCIFLCNDPQMWLSNTCDGGRMIHSWTGNFIVTIDISCAEIGNLKSMNCPELFFLHLKMVWCLHFVGSVPKQKYQPVTSANRYVSLWVYQVGAYVFFPQFTSLIQTSYIVLLLL